MNKDIVLVVFQDKKIRRLWHNEQWYFSIIDIIGALAVSSYPRNYWKVLKHRLIEEGSNETVTKCNQLKLPAEDGKLRETDCASTETLFRLIQSTSSFHIPAVSLMIFFFSIFLLKLAVCFKNVV